jgi:subtilisin family serine protease
LVQFFVFNLYKNNVKSSIAREIKMKKIITLLVSSIIMTGCGVNDPVLTGAETPPVITAPETVAVNNFPAASPVTVSKTVKTETKPVVSKSLVSSNKAPASTIITPLINKVNIAQNYNTENILVGLKSETDLGKAREISAKYNITIDNFIKGINTVVYTTNGQNVPVLLKKLAAENLFSFIETDNISSNKPEKETDLIDELFNILSTDIVNDKYFKDQYGLTATHVPESWAISTGKRSIISIIDSGVEVNHDDLKKNVVPGYDAFSKKEGAKAANASMLNYISDTFKHGSHVAGIAAAEANNSKGIAGVAPDAKILPVKIFPDFTDYFKASQKNDDGSDVTVVSAIADGIVWSVDHHADVINMSLGVWEPSVTLEKAVKYAIDHNVSVVVAAGNERSSGNRINYLAAINGVIAVGATDQDNKITSFSNSGSYVSLVAPGFDIISSTPSFLGLKPYRKMSGTSMAAPHVAGIVALLRDKFGETATPQWIKERLEKTATDLGPEGRDDLYGNGLVNAFKALNEPI